MGGGKLEELESRKKEGTLSYGRIINKLKRADNVKIVQQCNLTTIRQIVIMNLRLMITIL